MVAVAKSKLAKKGARTKESKSRVTRKIRERGVVARKKGVPQATTVPSGEQQQVIARKQADAAQRVDRLATGT